MIAALLKEKADEIKHKDFCTEGLNTNERETELKQRDIDELDAKLSELTSKLDTLTKALDVLKKVFDKKFIQLSAKAKKQEPAGPPPPPGFKEYKQSSGSGGVMGMIEQIIRDTETLEAEATKAETDA